MVYESRITLPASGVQSLCWEGDSLIDWVGGRVRYGLDGSVQGGGANFAYRFDAAESSPSGRFVVVYERLGTKAILLENGRILRELNRSYYHAHLFEYPLALFALPNGLEAIAHCPHQVNQIEIEELATGKPLTARPRADRTHTFYSRLAASPAGTHLLSAGWVWQPLDTLSVFDLRTARAQPETLDCPIPLGEIPAPIHHAAFVDERTVVASGISQGDQPALFVLDLARRELISKVNLEQTEGLLMPLDSSHVVGFYDHPKLIHLPTGKTVYHWHDLRTGTSLSSRTNGTIPPPLALDPARRRFAVAGVNAITVVTVG